jgi:hypothetical protein
LLHSDIVPARGTRPARAKVRLGAAFQGIKKGVFTSDGTVLEGVIDGRRIVPLPMDQGPPDSIEFADGNPPPEVQVDPGVREALTAINAQASSEVDTHAPAVKSQFSTCGQCLNEALIQFDLCEFDAHARCSPSLALFLIGLILYLACRIPASQECRNVYGQFLRQLCFGPEGPCTRAGITLPTPSPAPCPGGGFQCGTVCCSEGELCCEGVCTPGPPFGGCCGAGVRCPINSTCCGRVCCPFPQLCVFDSNGQPSHCGG